MKKKSIAYITVALLAGAGVVTQQWINRANAGDPLPTHTAPILETNPTDAVTTEGCYFVWASRDLPELSGQLQQTIQEVQPEAQARAEAFGEECVFADGHAEFGAMETDFYLVLQVNDINDTSKLGDWISQIMPLIDHLPPEQVPGGQPGFVEFKFSQNENKFIFVRVPIARYQREAQGKTGSELFELFR